MPPRDLSAAGRVRVGSVRLGNVRVRRRSTRDSAGSLELRIGVETLRNPFWYAEHGRQAEAQQFWDRAGWDRALRVWANEHYNAILYWVEPWSKSGWQTFLIRHRKFPEARDLRPEQYYRAIEQADWIFHRAHDSG